MKLSNILLVQLLSLSITPSYAADPPYEPIANYHSSSIFAQIGQPVGRLRTETSLGRSGCTAFLISETHLMTNEHCIGKRAWDSANNKWLTRTISSVKVEMGAINPSDNSDIETFSVQMPALEINQELDYAILKVNGNPAAKYGYLAISYEKPKYKTPLWIIGHPKLLVQQISRLGCRSILHDKPHINRLHHTCPTIGGNSGSPVFDASTGKVIAIHHASYSIEKTGVGLAVSFHTIAKQSPLLREIAQSQ